MNRRMRAVAAAGAGLLLAAGGVGGMGGARADHDHLPGQTITVEGSASSAALDTTPATARVLWRCQALTTGGVVASTGISCELRRSGSTIDSTAIAMEGNQVSSVPRTVTLVRGSYEVCWTARALTRHGQFVYDVTAPNCAPFTA